MRNFVRKNMHLTCRASIQQSKRRQALMAASVQDEAEVLFEGEIPQRNGDVQLDSDGDVGYTYAKVGYTTTYYDEISEMNWEDAHARMDDIGVSSIDIGGDEE